MVTRRRYVGNTRTTVRVAVVARQALRAILFVLFFVGLTSAAWLGLWLTALAMFIFGDAEDPGLVAEAPHWLLLPVPLSFLGFLPSVQKTVRETLKRMGIED